MERISERFIQCGIAEANMMGVGRTDYRRQDPITTTFANFSTGRVYGPDTPKYRIQRKKCEDLCIACGTDPRGRQRHHQILEDIGMMKMLPGMTVIVPADYNQTKAATKAVANFEGPVYLRFGRPVWPIFTKKQTLRDR